MLAGIWGFSAPLGIALLVMSQLFVGIVYALALGMKAEPYFTSLFQVITSNILTNGLTFTLVWVTFYNVVHVL
jgi:hypothetical protein